MKKYKEEFIRKAVKRYERKPGSKIVVKMANELGVSYATVYKWLKEGGVKLFDGRRGRTPNKKV